jgi:hypothetical protein
MEQCSNNEKIYKFGIILCNSMDTEESIDILEQLFDTKLLDVIKLFLADQTKQYYLREVSKLTKVPVATTFRYLNKLANLGVIKIIVIKNIKLYQLEENKKTEYLKKIMKKEDRIIDIFITRISQVYGLKSVLLHGIQTQDKANVLLIGRDMDPNEIKRICADIKEKFSFTVSSLSLTEEQFEQMSAMGLYPGKKKVIFTK